MKKKFFTKNIEIFIYSRSNSKRLKNKFKEKIGEYTLVELLIIRLLNHFDKKMIKLCVPTKDKQKYIKVSTNNDIQIITGPEQDLIKRTLLNIKKLDAIVRVTADDPLTSPELIKKFINIYQKKKYDYIYTYDIADGLIPELISRRYLLHIYKNIINKKYSNFMTYYLIRDFKNYSKLNYKSSNAYISDISLTVDYKKDLLILKNFFRDINYDYLISTKKIINFIKKNKGQFQKFKRKKFFLLKTKNYDVSLKGDIIKKFQLK